MANVFEIVETVKKEQRWPWHSLLLELHLTIITVIQKDCKINKPKQRFS